MRADLRTVQPDRFVSVPTEVEAVQWTRENRQRVLTWLHESGVTFFTGGSLDMELRLVTRTTHVDLAVGTPQGMKPVQPGDWIVKGVVGEFYPVADRVFQLRYRSLTD